MSSKLTARDRCRASDGQPAESSWSALGRNLPGNSVPWDPNAFTTPASDFGERSRIEFDGGFREWIIWINSHSLGWKPSGYSSFGYYLTEFGNYGGGSVVVVRVDALGGGVIL